MDNGEYLISIGKKVRAIRKAKGISMRQLVVLAPIHKSSLSEIENGLMNVKILALKKLADTLGVDVKDFL
jgi:transcriptional regulator with XRE-family HTH domain